MPQQEKPKVYVPAAQDLPFVVAEMIQVIEVMTNRIVLLEMEIYRLGGFRDGYTVN